MGSLPIIWKESGTSYEEALLGRVFNRRRPNRSPLAVIKASDTVHVVEAVKLAIGRKTRISVRSGGHNWAVSTVRDNSILLDLGNLQELSYDDATGVVRVSPSTTSAELNAFLRPKGRMFAGGHCPDVAVGGFLLLGGVGWNARCWGWACEQVLAVDVITANGQVIRADEEQNADLFWASRGCGPAFPGVITRFHLRTRPLPTVMRSSAYIYPVSDYHTAFEWVLKLTSSFDDETEIVMISTHPPGLDELHLIILFIAFKSTEKDAHTALQPAESSFPGKPVLQWFCKETSLEKEYAAQAHANPSGHRYLCENAFIDDDADIITVLERALTTSPSKETYAFWYPLSPWSRRELPDMALSLRTDNYIALYTIWKDEKDDAGCESWVQDIIQDIKKHSAGSYLGDIDLQQRTTKFWNDDNGKELMNIRQKWDPQGTICGYLDAGDKSGIAGLDNKLDVS